jgi:hypothetical protein
MAEGAKGAYRRRDRQLGLTCMTSASHINGILQRARATTRLRPNSAAALTLVAVAFFSVVGPLIDPCGWLHADAQGPQAPTGHRQPTAADIAKIDPLKKNDAATKADKAMDRALNNICRGCSPQVAVGNVPRYDVAVTCREAAPYGRDTCPREEQEARNLLNQQWSQFTTAGRSNCIQTAAIGGRPSYVELFICLKATYIAPTTPDAR